MARPMPHLGPRTPFIRAGMPPRPEWAPDSAKKEQLTARPGVEDKCFTVADYRREATAPTIHEEGTWVAWESFRLQARVNEDGGAVWVLLIKLASNGDFTRISSTKRWLYFEEFMADYPKTAQVLRPVDEACYRRVQWEGWMGDDWEPEQLEGAGVGDDIELQSWRNDLAHREKVLEQGAIRVRWNAIFK